MQYPEHLVNQSVENIHVSKIIAAFKIFERMNRDFKTSANNLPILEVFVYLQLQARVLAELQAILTLFWGHELLHGNDSLRQPEHSDK